MNVLPGDIPPPSIRRLSIYLRQLESLEGRGIKTISSQKLAESLGLTGAQVRKDLAYFGQFGKSGLGYEVVPLIHRLRRILGTDRVVHALLIGMGNLGTALASYQGFRPKGFELVALFDTDRRKIGRKAGALVIEPLEKLQSTIKQRQIRLGIIAVPAEAAQFVADRLIAAGICGILNFAPVPLTAPPEVPVRYIDVAAELEQLNFLTQR
jgi:redox-sensing transcriptional repressor